jgi:hypothetical protein
MFHPGRFPLPIRAVYPLYFGGVLSYIYIMENDLYTYTFCREDWERIMGALRVAAVTNYQEADRIGPESIYGSTLFQEGAYCQALADDIDFKLPE